MIYIDLGCHNGDTIKDFYEGKFGGISPIGVASVGVDPLTKYQEKWAGLSKLYGTVFIQKAAWIFDGGVEFSENDYDYKSSVMKDKWVYGGKLCKIHKVSCFDFSDYLKKLDDEAVIRMDIEGAEYHILGRMIKDGTISKVKYLEVEWHSHKMNGEWRKIGEEIEKKMKDLKVNFKILKP